MVDGFASICAVVPSKYVVCAGLTLIDPDPFVPKVSDHKGRNLAVKALFASAVNETGATAVAEILGGVQIQPVATPAPVEGGSLGEAQVLVMLGTDLAGKLLPGALPAAPVEATTTTVAPA